MSIHMILCVACLAYVIQQITQTERSKQEIMSIFGLLSTEDVERVFQVCENFLDRFVDQEEVAELLQAPI